MPVPIRRSTSAQGDHRDDAVRNEHLVRTNLPIGVRCITRASANPQDDSIVTETAVIASVTAAVHQYHGRRDRVIVARPDERGVVRGDDLMRCRLSRA